MCVGMSYLPLLLVILASATFIASYIIALAEKDVVAFFPYISDTGTKSPESCIFGQFLNIAAALSVCTIYVRFKLVQQLIEEDEYHRYSCINKTGLVFGVLSSLGLSMVANFQETNVEPVHVIGAALVLGAGVIYSFIQTKISYRMHPQFNGIKICRWRLYLSIVSLVTMLTAFIAAIISRYQGSPKDRLHWKPKEEGYTAHIVSTITEWVTALFFLFFFLTYVRDFQKIRIEIHGRMHVRHLDDDIFQSNEPNERTPILS